MGEAAVKPTTAERTADLFTFDEFIRFWAADRSQGVALDGPDRTLTYGGLDSTTARVVAGLVDLGIGKGDRIAWFGKNSTLYFTLFFAAARLGAVMVPIGWRLAPAEAMWIADDAQAKAVFLGLGFEGLAETFSALPAVRIALTQDEAWRWIDAQQPIAFEAAGPDDAVLQLYTSGTTGNPKGAVLSNRNLFGLRKQSLGQEQPYTQMTDDEAILVAMPCAHIGGTGLGVMAIGAGLPGIILAEFEPRAVFDAVEQRALRASSSCLPPCRCCSITPIAPAWTSAA